MKHFAKIFPILLIVLLYLLAVTGCSAAKSTVDPNLNWTIVVDKFEIKDKLEGIQEVDQYVGTTEEVHQQYPDEGNVYLVMNLTINKQGKAPGAFDWKMLTVQDEAGTAYSRHSNDSFLDLFDDYSPRMTGLELQLGEHTGWVCFELPADAANGKLMLVYTGEGSQQQIVVK